ncbi:hypothetical protein PAECIP111893_00460 [Paenibacillus plantiphilus]|uniref:Uncharacterized protein n=1 Tax=Paenibacillus plantiphilus TaxID=2905650 RepID=A0ABM9BUM4_9BACL|nr:hypothetical protein [Paenibacillus plantiphilus]CAH1193425.1 hypothetical protein PAECIP111893_00460 [Paenibacillus plantiphilus]
MGVGGVAVLFVFVLIVMISVVVVRSSSKNRGSRVGGGSSPRISRISPSVFASKPPVALGVPEGHPAHSAAKRLEAALSSDFEARVKDRVLKAQPRLRDDEWNWLWFELKRYFLMCALLRNVPMYSAKVDDVWHEILMFTWEYEQFGKQLCGSMIHHAPHAAGSKPNSGERAWFDWVYGELFEAAAPSSRLWGAFYRTPLSKERIAELQEHSREELLERHFNTAAAEKFEDLRSAMHYLIERGSSLARAALDRRPADRNSANDTANWGDPVYMTGILSGALFFASMDSEDKFIQQMDGAQTKEQRDVTNNSSCGSSPAVYGSDDKGSGNDGSNSGCGGSSGGDSSGGGSSCGSSCGGGGCSS